MGNLRVRLKIHIGRGEYDPFSVRRWNRPIQALEFHHVLEREWMFCVLSKERSRQAEENYSEDSHVVSFYFVILSEVEESLTISANR
jgi:hypothetical protein